MQSNFNMKCSSLYLILSMLILVGHAEKIPAQDNDISWSDFSLAGEKVLSLSDTYYSPGTHQLTLLRDNLQAGMYLLEMANQDHSELLKLIIK